MLELKGKYCKDCKIFTDNIEQDALSMIYHFLDQAMFDNAKIRIMPDVHAGKDIVVGFTVPFSDHVNPDHVGGDIGCSVSTTITDQKVSKDEYPTIERKIRENVKFGMTIHENAKYEYRELYCYLKNAHQKARKQWPEMVNDIDISEKGITEFLKRVDQSEHMFYHSIGTVGGGNHFVEIGTTPDGCYAFTIHCGSRNLGQKVWKYWKMEAGKLTGITNGYLVGEAMKGYLTDMVIAQAYAEFNHKIIGKLILESICYASGKPVHVKEVVHTTHNYVDFQMKMLRKGAVAAPEGRRLVIPFNMRDGLIICRGKGNDDWNQSAPHGAGRLMSRAMAKELIALEDFQEVMQGIYSTSVCTGTIDESPMAYKDPEEILQLIAPTVEVEYFIRPIINLKATSSYE